MNYNIFFMDVVDCITLNIQYYFEIKFQFLSKPID